MLMKGPFHPAVRNQDLTRQIRERSDAVPGLRGHIRFIRDRLKPVQEENHLIVWAL